MGASYQTVWSVAAYPELRYLSGDLDKVLSQEHCLTEVCVTLTVGFTALRV